jgi:acetyltransferase
MSLLRSLLEPKSVVVIGARNEGLGATVSANLLGSRHDRQAFLVGPGGSLAQAGRWYDNVADLPMTPDLAVICTTAEAAAAALDQAGRKGIKAAVMVTADPFGRDPGTPLKKSLKEVGQHHGCRFLGPGSVGINMPAIGLNASWFGKRLASGSLALVSQSGSIAASVAEWATLHGIGLSRVISMGDEADIGVDEILDYLAADARTTGILLYIQSLTGGRSFISSARAAARIKPVLVLKPRENPMLPQPDEPSVDQDAVYDAAFRRAGLLRVYDTAEWFDAAESLSRVQRRRGGKLAIIANGNGPGRLAAVPTAAVGLLVDFQDKTVATLQRLLPGRIPAGNPLDLGRDAVAEHYAGALAALQDDVNIAAVLIIYAPSLSASSAAVAKVVAEAAKNTSLHILACWFGPSVDDETRTLFADANVALHDVPEKAGRAFIHLHRYRKNQETLRQIPASRRQQLVAAAAESTANGAAALSPHALLLTDEKESAALLKAYGNIWRAIKAKRGALDGEESIALLRAYGFPVLQTKFANGAERELHEILPLPLSFSVANDIVFGRVILVTVAGKRFVALPPLNNELTHELVADINAVLRMVAGLEVKASSVRECLIRLADLIVVLPEIVALEIWSLGLDNGELVARDARIRISAPERMSNHLAIHPYPRELEERINLKSGQEVLMRPMRIEDIRLYHEMLNSIPHEEIYLRFCSRFGDLAQAIPTELLANLIHFDYSRDMTFIAIGVGSGGEAEALGLVDAFIAPSREQAEYSILVRTDVAGTGLGKALMTKIIGYCRAQGVASVFGLVLRDNSKMLGLCTRLAFARAPDDGDDDMVKVVLPL